MDARELFRAAHDDIDRSYGVAPHMADHLLRRATARAVLAVAAALGADADTPEVATDALIHALREDEDRVPLRVNMPPNGDAAPEEGP